MEINLTIVAVCVVYFALTLMYGRIKYNEGVRLGVQAGSLTMGETLLKLFQKRRVIDQHKQGNIFRLNDTGERGETIISAVNKLKP